MFKIRITEKALKNKKKLFVESKLDLTKKDFLFIFNKNIIKINKQKNDKSNIFILTFKKPLNNEEIYFLNFVSNNDFKK